MMVRDIAHYGDSVVMGYYQGGVHKFADSSVFNGLYRAAREINRSFEGAMDTVDPGFAVKLYAKGTRRLIDAQIFLPNSNVMPAVIMPVKEVVESPVAYSVYQNYPNPFNPTTTIEFDLPDPSIVTLKVYDILGQEVATLLNHEQMDDGRQEVEFDAATLASGVYFYRLVAEEVDDDGAKMHTFQTVRKMLLLK
ncbi:MAG: T9SS type A sorting domain-containing protein [Ignavibacteria bacterium]|nr:T9SS type A sorting domain-containing protein [Ignavibacteria bacterium]MBI3766261.1 T9SS type A sorting domain-containing protein [Ignavibacteriales bacterium]